MEQSLLLKLASPVIIDNTTSRLRQEYQDCQILMNAQPVPVQQFLSDQAKIISEAIAQNLPQIRFHLPEAVVCPPGIADGLKMESTPVDLRAQSVGGIWARITRTNMLDRICQLLAGFEVSTNRAASASGVLIRYAIAYHLVYNTLPTGAPVIYASVDGNDIPNRPVVRDADKSAALSLQSSRNYVDALPGMGDEVFQASSADDALRFYLPQWVAFDDQGCLISGSISEAEADISSMQHYLAVLQSALTIAPYMIADERWQQKRYGMLGQLVNQGRALANYKSQEMIKKIRQRAEEHKLDRGLRLSLPYFNDQKLVIEDYDFMVIPSGWVMFVPAFVVLAAREQQIKVAGETDLSFATRRHLLAELENLEKAF